jgi:hypothetical protein
MRHTPGDRALPYVYMAPKDAREVAKSHFPLASLLERCEGRSKEIPDALWCQPLDAIEVYQTTLTTFAKMFEPLSRDTESVEGDHGDRGTDTQAVAGVLPELQSYVETASS